MKGAFEHACRLWEEKIPTTYPIKLSVRFASMQNPQCLAIVNVNYSDQNGEYDKVYEKRYGQIRDWQYSSIEYLRDDPDAVITFTSKKVFDYSINGNEISPDKYDFVTVAIQAIGKAVGFVCTANYIDDGKFEKGSPCNKFTSNILYSDAEGNYQRVTSDNLYIRGRQSSESWPIYCPPLLDEKFTCSYFKEDNENVETLFMQPGVCKGSKIRYIGKSVEDFWGFCDWDRDIVTGMGGNSYTETASTDDVIPYQGNSSKSVSKVSAMNTSVSSDTEDLYDYVYNRYEIGEQGFFVLMQNGAWKKINSYNDLSLDVNYARTSDGYIRTKRVYRIPGPDFYYYNYIAEYELYDFPPQFPEASMNSYVLSSDISASRAKVRKGLLSNLTTNVYVDVEIGFKILRGVLIFLLNRLIRIILFHIHTLWMLIPGCFIAYMNKKYPSTFKLTYYNKNGECVGEPFTIDLRDNVAHRYDFDLKLCEEKLMYEFSVEKEITGDIRIDYSLVKIDESVVTFKGVLSDPKGCIDISKLPKGTYVLSLNFKGQTYSSKFMK